MTSQTATAARADRPAALDRLLAARLAINGEIALYVAVFAAGFALRFWDLGSRALHHDESIHAQWSWKLIQGDYTHSPIFHGPLYYHVQGLVFLILGDNDYTARVSAALFGTAMVALPLLLRKRLGLVGTFAAVAFIAFSPTLVYYSRFFREDIYMAVFTLLMVVSFWRYIDEGRDRWLYVMAASFVGAVLVKEGAFLTFAVFLVYLDLHLSAELGRRMLVARDLDERWRRWAMTFFLAPYAWIIAALWPFFPALRRRFDLGDELPRTGDLLVLLGTLTLPLLTPISRVFVLEKFGIVEKDRLNWEKQFADGSISANDALALAGLFAISVSAAAFVGLQWRPKVWAIAFAVGTAVYLTLMTSFWRNEMGLVSGPWGSLDYWYSQHDATRGDQPWFYYYLLMPAYEFLPLALCIGGAWWSTVRGNAFSRFLWTWLVGMWLALSWGGEKMPWLNVHLALPAAVLAGWTVQRAWGAWTERPALRRVLLPLASVAAISAGALALIAFLPGGSGYLAVRLVVLALAVGVILFTVRPFGARAAGTVAVVACVGALAFFSLRTMVGVVYERGDVPEDMLIYTQSSPDIPDIMASINQLAETSGKGHNLPIAVDSADSFAWPWAWYLRDYKAVSYVDMSNGAPKGEFEVLLVNKANEDKVNDTIAASGTLYGSPQPYPHRWWFDERYKSAMRVDQFDCTAKAGECGPFRLATWKHIFSHVFDGSWPGTWAKYWRDHEADEIYGAPDRGSRCNSCGSVDAVAYFPANFDVTTGKLSALPLEPPKPTTDADGHPKFGGYGLLPGQFLSPIDIEPDGEGNLYVIDSSTRKLSKFDAQGNFITSVDIRDTAGDPQEASEPWGLAVSPEGMVVVADTFGWRVRTFDKDLKPTGGFGKQPADVGPNAKPSPQELYGPRDAAFDADGNLWVTDTGFDRINVYRPNGEYIRTIGGVEGSGEGQFNEPVGIAIASDGTVFVADMFNARVVLLNGDGSWQGSFPVEGWGGQQVTDKPYLEALPDGRLAVSLPSNSEVRIYDRDGTLSGHVDGGSTALDFPYGMTAVDGGLWVVEGGSTADVRLLPIANSR
ncbi:MAG: flippase activity-associated protein Agl23 [Hyphomicrobiales bacterium]